MPCKFHALLLSIALGSVFVTSSAKAEVPDVMCATVQVCDFDSPSGIDPAFAKGPCAREYMANCYVSLLGFLRGCADVLLSKKPQKPTKYRKPRRRERGDSEGIKLSRIR